MLRKLYYITTLILVSCSASFAQITLENGIVLYEAKNFPQAKPIFEQLYKQDDKNDKALFYLGWISMDYDKNYDDAVDYFKKCIELNDTSSKYHYSLGAAYGSKARISGILKQAFLAAKVKKEFGLAVELDSTYLQAQQGLIQFYILAPGIMGGSIEKAKVQCAVLVRHHPLEGNIQFATLYEHEEDTVQAEEYYKKAIAANPAKGIGYSRLGYFYLKMKRFEESITEFQHFAEIEPDKASPYNCLGDAYDAQDKPDEAIKEYQKAITTDSLFAPPYYNLGTCFEKKRMKEESKNYFRHYLLIEPNGKKADDVREKVKEE